MPDLHPLQIPPAADSQQLRELLSGVEALSPLQQFWLSGYLAGKAGIAEGASAGVSQQRVVVLYASQTGNGVGIANRLQQQLAQAGVGCELFDALDYRRAQLKTAEVLLLIASTHGEGDVPDTAVEFAEYLNSDKAAVLESVKYSVLALGDRSYVHFCKVGREFHQRLSDLGAEEGVELHECDSDFSAAAQQWSDRVCDWLRAELPERQPAALVTSQPAALGKNYSRQSPWQAEVLTNLTLSGRGSSKQINHLELSLEDSGIGYVPGDSIGIIAPNPAPLVQQILDFVAIRADETVTAADGTRVSLGEALTSQYEIAPLSRVVVERRNQLESVSDLQRLLQPDAASELSDWLYGRDLLDLLQEYPLPGISAEQLLGLLRPRQPRLYSIASSPLANPDEVHLTIARVGYQRGGRERTGVASGWIADSVAVGDSLPIYRHENPLFRLPESADAPVIMIGPGTGVAPFRAFIEHRDALDCPGKNWLFFGDRNFTTDFLYQREWQDYLRRGRLSRIDLAFSRDQQNKIYLQQRMVEQSREFYSWLEEGASLYVCGDASRMAVDVHQALLEIIKKEGALSQDSAADYVSQLQRDRRYQRDVY